MSRRLVFLGTPEMAVPELRALHAAGHEIALVVTRPDRRRGRGGAMTPSPVKAAALELGLPVSEVVDDVIAVAVERGGDELLGVVVAYGRIIKPHVLAAVPMVNVHFSLLPRWRGAAPVERALLAGDAVTGVCIMEVTEGLDEGGVHASAEVPIGPTTTADELRAALVAVGTDLLVDVVGAVDLPGAVAQSGDVTYAAKIEQGEWRIEWSQPAVAIDRLVRCGNAWTTLRAKRMRVHAADLVDDVSGAEPGTLTGPDGTVAAGGGALRLRRVQPEGKSAMAWSDFANGAQPTIGELFT